MLKHKKKILVIFIKYHNVIIYIIYFCIISYNIVMINSRENQCLGKLYHRKLHPASTNIVELLHNYNRMKTYESNEDPNYFEEMRSQKYSK